jgi:hypothetical protein
MAAAGVRFRELSEEEMRQWTEEHPGPVNEQDSVGHTLLTAAVAENRSLNFITWLVNEKCVHIDARDQWGKTATFYAKSVDVLSFLLERGADPMLQASYGWTVLMWHSLTLRANCVARLLQDHRVDAFIDEGIVVQRVGDWMGGCSALHVACIHPGSDDQRARVVELLLFHGANPLLRDTRGCTALDALRQYRSHDIASRSLLERAIAEPQRTFSLSKARYLSDANHAIGKAKATVDKEGRTRGEKMRKMLAKTPPYLKERVQGGQVEVPRVELKQPSNNENDNEN